MSLSQPRTAQERWFKTSDGTELFFRHWQAESAPSDRVVVLFHRGHEHSGRLQHIVDELEMGDVPMYAWDARGHGKSPGPRGHSIAQAWGVRCRTLTNLFAMWCRIAELRWKTSLSLRRALAPCWQPPGLMTMRLKFAR